MRFLSSIFSFSTLKLRPGLPGGLLFACGLLALIEYGIARANWPYRVIPASYVGELFETEQALRHGPPPTVVVLGNSRSAAALTPAALAASLGIAPERVANVGLRAGDTFDNLLIYRRNRDVFAHAKLLIYGVDGFQFNPHWPLNQRYYHFAGLQDRLALEGLPGLPGYFVRSLAKRKLFLELQYAIRTRLLARHKQDGGGGIDQEIPYNERLAQWYGQYSLSDARLAQVKSVILAAQADGLPVVVVQIPFRDAFFDALSDKCAKQYAAYQRGIRDGVGCPVVWYEKASECGLTNRADFYDYGHMNSGGAERFCRALAQSLHLMPELKLPSLSSPE